MQAVLTDHAVDRVKERLGLSHEAAHRLASIALTNGQPHATLTGKVKEYCDQLWQFNRSINNIRVYGEFIYLFDKNVLVTTWPLPKDLRKVIFKVRKKEEKMQTFNTIPQINLNTQKPLPVIPNAPLVRPTQLEVKPPSKVKYDSALFFKALEAKTKLGRGELAKKFDISNNTMLELFEGKSRKIGPFLETLFSLDAGMSEAYQKMTHHYTETVLKESLKATALEKIMTMEAQLRTLRREYQGM